MNFTGLSLEQAPPFNAPLRFFLTAPLFGMLAAVALLSTEPSFLDSRHSFEVIGLVHLFTIGFFAMVMLGALQQMLPVLAGVSLPRPVVTATSVHLLLCLGTLLIAAGFYTGIKALFLTAAVTLGLGFLGMLSVIAWAMLKVTYVTPTVRAMMIAVALALVTVSAGLHLLGSYATEHFGALHVAVADIHSVFGIFGFALLLVVGVSFQVLPMFYVTPAYGLFFTRYLPPLLTSTLLLWAVLGIVEAESVWMAKILAFILFGAFAVSIFLKLAARRRPVSDVTIAYWYLSALLLICGLAVWVYNSWSTSDFSILAALFVGASIMAVMTGMLYKIVPFLAWFHLNAMGYMTIPTMKEMLHEKMAKVQFLMFLVTFAFLAGAFFGTVPVWAGATALFISMALLELNLIIVVRTYLAIKQSPPEFSFEMPQN